MKVLLALAVLSSSAVGFAASDRAIYDVMYLPNGGTTYGISDVAYLSRNISGKNGAVDQKISGFGIAQTVGHSFSDKFSLAASLEYLNAKIDPDGGTKTDQTGISDPSLTARYRLMDDKYRLDIIGGALVSLGDSKVKSNGDTDNRQGGPALNIGAQFGQKSENLQWSVTGQLTHNLERTYDAPSADIDADATNDFLLQADMLNKLGEKSFLRSFASVDFMGRVESDDQTPETINASSTSYALGTEYQHLCSQDLLARVGADYRMTNSDSAYTDSDNQLTLHIGATYQF